MRNLPLFACVAILAAAGTSFLLYFAAKRLGIYNKPLIAGVSALNALFCVAFPPLIAFFGGRGGGAPRNPAAVLAVMALLSAIYACAVIWRVVLRSPSFKPDIPIPAPDPPEPAFESGNDKNIVDSAINIDKMGMNAEPRRETDENDVKIDDFYENGVDLALNRAFDSLVSGKMEEAAEYFISAIEMRPPLSLEIQIAIQLSMIYMDLGCADLSFDIMAGYDAKYGNRLSGEDKERLDAAVSIVKSAVAGAGGDGYEEN